MKVAELPHVLQATRNNV